MRFCALSAALLMTLSACQGNGSTSVAQELSFVCTVASAAGPITQIVLASVDPGALAVADAAELVAARVCAKIGGTPTQSVAQAKRAIRLSAN